jgi:acylphosphatase
VRVHAFVAGVVQGVGFRYFVAREARRLGLAGFVRNLPDGRVEVVAEGERAALERLVAALRTGPPSAEVQDVRVEWSDAPDRGGDFLIR